MNVSQYHKSINRICKMLKESRHHVTEDDIDRQGEETCLKWAHLSMKKALAELVELEKGMPSFDNADDEVPLGEQECERYDVDVNEEGRQVCLRCSEDDKDMCPPCTERYSRGIMPWEWHGRFGVEA